MEKPHSGTIGFDALMLVLREIDRRMAALAMRQPSLSAYAVLSSPVGQTEASNSPRAMIEEFPDLFLDSPAESAAVELVRRVGVLEKRRENALFLGRLAGAATADGDILGKLTLAILNRQIATLCYRRLEEDRSCLVDEYPHRLIERDQCRYPIAEDLERGGQRAYAIPRVS